MRLEPEQNKIKCGKEHFAEKIFLQHRFTNEMKYRFTFQCVSCLGCSKLPKLYYISWQYDIIAYSLRFSHYITETFTIKGDDTTSSSYTIVFQRIFCDVKVVS